LLDIIDFIRDTHASRLRGYRGADADLILRLLLHDPVTDSDVTADNGSVGSIRPDIGSGDAGTTGSNFLDAANSRWEYEPPSSSHKGKLGSPDGGLSI